MSARNHEVTTVHQLLDEKGHLIEPGWSRRLYQIYDRNKIKAPAIKIKEWDYYLVTGDDFAAAFTLSDDGYIGLESASILDFTDPKNPWEHTNSVLVPFTMGKMKLPSTSESGDIAFHNKTLDMAFYKSKEYRRIVCEYRNFFDGKTLEADITLYEPYQDTLVIATPWANSKTSFYYNQKINCMNAQGYVKFAGKTYKFNPENNYGTLDWGRGVWTYDNTWYWSSANKTIDGKPFGFNLGYGFGDTKAASENIVFYDRKGSKLDDVKFNIPRKSDGSFDYMSKWTFTSSDDRFNADFVPVLDRAADMDFKVLVSDQHQVFGKMTGYAILDSGEKVNFKDMFMFAEHVHNRY